MNLFYFNSRLLTETNIVEVSCFACFFISIHVSFRRRTFIEFGLCKNAAISNHVSLRKRTDSYCLEYCAREFQLTSPSGDEHKSLVAVLINQLNFNSRLRKETNCMPASIHALSYFTFQLTSPRGNERSLRTAYGQGIRPFQLTSPQGDEPLIIFLIKRVIYFNSHLRKETNLIKVCYNKLV